VGQWSTPEFGSEPFPSTIEQLAAAEESNAATKFWSGHLSFASDDFGVADVKQQQQRAEQQESSPAEWLSPFASPDCPNINNNKQFGSSSC
jgi:hypothetical protein